MSETNRPMERLTGAAVPAPRATAPAAPAEPAPALPADEIAQAESDLWALIRIAVPSIAATVSGTVMSIVDFYFVSWLGKEAQAAVGNASVLVWAFFGLSVGTVSAVSTFASQALGRGRPREGAAYMWQAVYLSVVMGVLCAALIPAVPRVYAAMGHAPQVQALEVTFTRIFLLAAAPITAAAAISNYFNGIHRPVVTMTSMIAANVLNAVLCYGLVFGALGLPRMGVAGAATATLIALVFRNAWLAAALGRARFRRQFEPFAAWRYRAGRMWDLLRIGMPAGLQWTLEIGVWALFANWIIGRFGTVDLAATHVVWKLLELSWMPAIGIGVGINAVVGKAVGQGDADLAYRRTRVGLWLCAGYMGLMGVLFVVLRDWLPGWFTDDPSVRQLTATLMLLAATFQIFDAMSITYSSALRGAGDTKWPAIVIAVYCYVIVLVGGWLIGHFWPEMGSVGPWITSTVYAMFASLTLRYRWMRGHWRRIDIFAAGAQAAVPAMPR